MIISFYSKHFAPRSRTFEIDSTYSGFFLQVFPSRNKVNRTNPPVVVVQRRLRNVHKKRDARANFDVLPIKPIAFFFFALFVAVAVVVA